MWPGIMVSQACLLREECLQILIFVSSFVDKKEPSGGEGIRVQMAWSLSCFWDGHMDSPLSLRDKRPSDYIQGGILRGNFVEGMQWGPGALELHSPCHCRHPGGLQFQKHQRQLSWARLVGKHSEPGIRVPEGSAIGEMSEKEKASRKRMTFQRFHTESEVNRCRTFSKTEVTDETS